MPHIQVYLLLNSLPQDPPSFASLLNSLRQTSRFSVTVINNGQPFSSKRLFNQLGLTCRLQDLPLRFHPAQLLAQQLDAPSRSQYFLWLEDRLLWHPSHLLNWLAALDSWTWISPRLLPDQALPQSTRSYQVQALSPPQQEARLQPWQPECFPPCLCFSRAGIPTLREWLRAQGQLPLLMLGACDTATPAWHPGPASEPSQTDFGLTISEALERWQLIQTQGPGPRQQALLESLVRALPDSPAVYTQLAPLLEAAAAIELLEGALCRKLIYPELLSLMGQALIACHQPELAAIYLQYLSQRFAGFEASASPWPQRAGAGIRLKACAMPKLARLSVCILLEQAADLQPILTSLRPLQPEILIMALVSLDSQSARVIELESARGLDIQVRSCGWNGDLSLIRNQALEQLSGDWVLMLNADETLEQTSLALLKRLLSDPPVGLPCFIASIETYDQEQKRLSLNQEVRLFANHPMLRYQGKMLEELSYQGPGETSQQSLSGLRIQAQRASSKLLEQRLLALQQLAEQEPTNPRWAAAAALQLAELERHQEALQAYQQALAYPESLTRSQALACSLGCLESLLKLAEHEQALTLVLQAEKLCQEQPRYWYLRGLLQQFKQDEPQAIQAFERCLETIESSSQPHFDQNPEQPLEALAELYRKQAHSPALDPSRRQALTQKWLKTLKTLLGLRPQGEHKRTSYYLYLAEAALLAAQRGLSALSIYREALPGASENWNWAYYAETALLYLEGPSESLQDRLPADYSYETIRDLQLKPYTLLSFCEALWQRPEVDGPQLAAALLHLSAMAHQDLSLWSLLSLLYESTQEPEAALETLYSAQLQLSNNAYLLYQIAHLQFKQADLVQAQINLAKALSIKPDLEDARHLQQLIQARKRQKRYTEESSA